MTARHLAIAVTLILAGPAAAAPVTLTWSAPAGCPERERVEERIERELGGTPLLEGQPAVDATFTVVHDDATWRLRLAIRHEATTLGERELAGATCDEVIDAAVLIVALAMHEQAARATSAPPAPPPRMKPLSATVPPPPASTSAIQWAGDAVIGGETGGLPGIGPGFGLVAAILRAPVRIELGGMFWLGRRATLASSSAGGELDLVEGTLRGCYAVVGPDVGACVGLEVGSLGASGVDAANPMTHHTAWIAPELGVLATWPIQDRMSVVARAQIAVPVTRPHFVLDGNETDIFQPAVIAGGASLAIEARFR